MSTEERKLDLQKLLAVVPDAKEYLGAREKKKEVHELRVRIRKKEGLGSNIVVPRKIAQLLGIEDGCKVIISVKGDKLEGIAKVVDENIDGIIGDADRMREYGIEDNSIVTIRKA